MNDVLKEYNDIKEAIKNPKSINHGDIKTLLI